MIRAFPGDTMPRLLLALTIACLASPLSAAAPPPPNVVIVYADDLGYGDLGCYGNATIKTPHLDRMAREGTRFTSFYVAQPVCPASRASLLTGCCPNRIGIHGAPRPRPRAGLSTAAAQT